MKNQCLNATAVELMVKGKIGPAEVLAVISVRGGENSAIKFETVIRAYRRQVRVARASGSLESA
jgi:methionine synthase I (cobalamin-dependent)